MNKTECSQPQASYMCSSGPTSAMRTRWKLADRQGVPGAFKILGEVGPHGSQKILTGQSVIDRLRGILLSSLFRHQPEASMPARKCFDEPFGRI